MAMDFLHKLDQKKSGKLLTHMRRNALSNNADAYRATLDAAVTIASDWPDEGPSFGRSDFTGNDTHSAFVTADSCFVTKAKDSGKKGAKAPAADKTTPGSKKSLEEVECYVCGELGHYARDCKSRKSAAKALVAKSTVEKGNDDDEYESEEEDEMVYVTTLETVLFAKDDVLLDSQASVNVFCNRALLNNVRKSDRNVVLNGVQSGAAGVKITQVGDFNNVGKVYYSSEATANILSHAIMVDGGHQVRCDQRNDRFLLRPVGSNMVYSSCRKNIPGSEGRFYCCNVNSMVSEHATTYPTDDCVLIETETENISRYTKREIEGARKARNLLAKMGFHPVSQAIEIATRGVNFTVTGTDFQIANDIWGSDIASL